MNKGGVLVWEPAWPVGAAVRPRIRAGTGAPKGSEDQEVALESTIFTVMIMPITMAMTMITYTAI